MESISEQFQSQQHTRPFRACLITEAGVRLALDSAEYTAGGSGGRFGIGGSTAAEFTAVTTAEGAVEKGTSAALEFALVLENGQEETVSMGWFTITKVEGETDSRRRTLAGIDAMGSSLEEEFFLPEVPPATAKELLAAIARQSGLTLTGESLVPEAEITLTADSAGGTGRTQRELVQAVALLAGANAQIDRKGALALVRPGTERISITPKEYYQSALQVEEQDFVLGALEITQTVTVAAPQGQTEETSAFSQQLEGGTRGIQCSGEWFTQELFEQVWQAWQGYSFRPGTVKMLGELRLELWDTVEVSDRSGQSYSLPVLFLRHSFDGGIVTTVSASAPSGDGVFPVRQSVSQAIAGVKTELGRFRRLYAENLNAAYAQLNHITTEDIVGEHGTINLKKGTMQFGDALCWDGETLAVKGALQGESGSIGGWDIQPRQMKTTQSSQTYSEGVLAGEYYISGALIPPSETTAPGVTIAAEHWDADGSSAVCGGLAATLINSDDPTRGMTGVELFYSDGTEAYVRVQKASVAASSLPLIGGEEIPAGADLNQYTTRGKYYIVNNAVAAQVDNLPGTLAGALYCLFPLSPTRTQLSGAWDNMVQIFLNLLGDVYIRRVYNNRYGILGHDPWRKMSYEEV